MINEIFDFYYTRDVYPTRLKPLSREELRRGMSEEAVENYLTLVEQLYNALAFDVSDDYLPPPIEEQRERALVREKIYNSLIKHLFKQDAISDNAYCKLHEIMPVQFNYIEHPSVPGKYISDSVDDFRLELERAVVDYGLYISMRDSYLDDRYEYTVCVRPDTPEKQRVTSSDLYIRRFEESQTGIFSVEASYWEVKQLLKRIQEDMKRNSDEQKYLASGVCESKAGFRCNYASFHKRTYEPPKTIAEWYSIKRALEAEDDNLCRVEEEVRQIFDTMIKPQNGIGAGATLFIYKGKILCHQQQHPLVPATAILYDELDREIELNVEYCPKCNRYMLNYTSYENYRDRYAVLIGKLKMISSNGMGGEFDMAQESPLKLCGYNVSQADGLSSAARHFLLAKIIHDGIMSKLDVIHYLEHFINLNGSKKENAIALEKWREDLEFVHKYDIKTQPKVYITEVKKY